MINNFKNLKNKNGDDVEIVAVSKRSTTNEIMKVYDENHKNFGENRVKDLIIKYNKLPKDIRWHMIGHLQRNKVKDIIDFIHLIHSRSNILKKWIILVRTSWVINCKLIITNTKIC